MKINRDESGSYLRSLSEIPPSMAHDGPRRHFPRLETGQFGDCQRCDSSDSPVKWAVSRKWGYSTHTSFESN
jgi:hypothetical protein